MIAETERFKIEPGARRLNMDERFRVLQKKTMHGTFLFEEGEEDELIELLEASKHE